MTYNVVIHRASGSPSVRFGPFATVEDAFAWMRERNLHGGVEAINPIDVDTKAGAEVWC